MKKHILFLSMLMLAGCFTSVSADNALGEQIKKDLVQNTKFGGFVIGKASFNDQDLSSSNKNHTGMDLRLVRGYVDGKVLDFQYKLQLEYEGYGGTNEKGPHIIDAWAEWQKFSFFKVRAGQFKRCFTFENPMNPYDAHFGANGQVVSKLAGMSDRLGEHASGGRDLGIQVGGDLFKIGFDNHAFMHYQVGVYNGQGINHADQNNAKDLIGNLMFNPIKELTFAVFGWHGNYTSNGITVDRNRMAYSVRYDGPIYLAAEYVTSEGHKVSDYNAPGELKATAGGDGADGWYAFASIPVTTNKNLRVNARWDVYRDQKDWASAKRMGICGLEYTFCKNLKIQGNYALVSDRLSTTDKHYNTFDVQLFWRW